MVQSAGCHRQIRSFVRRQGRLTAAQQRALETLWPRYGLRADGHPLDLNEVFGRSAPRIMEIGFGMGDALAEMALRYPENDYLGIEVHRPGVGRLLQRLADQGSGNVRVLIDDAGLVLRDWMVDGCLDAVLVFFPDPWPKRRHHKRRLIQPGFVELLASKLRLGGRLHLATDWQDYAHHMMRVLSDAAAFGNTCGVDCFSPRPDYRPVTKFERRGHCLGHSIWDLVFERRPLRV